MWDCRKTRCPNNWKGKGTKLRFQEGRDRGKDKNKMWRYSNVIAPENKIPAWILGQIFLNGRNIQISVLMCVMDILGIDRDRFG